MRRLAIFIMPILVFLIIPRGYAQDESAPLEYFDLAWSPDGQWLAFAAGQEDGPRDIWLIRADGSSLEVPKNLTADSPLDDAYPLWMPDSAQLIFASSRAYPDTPDASFDAWRMDWDGSNPTLVENEAYDVMIADDLSPDGQFLLIGAVQRGEGDSAEYSFGLLRLADGQYTDLVDDHTITHNIRTFAPDGQSIAVSAETDESAAILIAPFADGTVGEMTPVLELGDASLHSFAWSPDSQWIAYSTLPSGRNPRVLEIFNVATREAALRFEMTPSDLQLVEAIWSPDGSKIAFGGVQGFGPRNVWVMNADGSPPTNISGGVQGDLHFSHVWSPDGSKIAFIAEEADDQRNLVRSDVWVINADGTHPINLTANVP